MSEQASYEYGRSPNHTDYDRARVDQYMSAIIGALVTAVPNKPPLNFIEGGDDVLLERCADLAVAVVKAVDDKIYETTP
jgi:hypothetical protein